jgi:hypothetical protein
MNIIKSTDGNNFITEKIISGKPFIASKMGAVEQNIITTRMKNQNYSGVRSQASNNAGITPSDDITLDFFYEKYIKALNNTDILGSMGLPQEQQIISSYAPSSIFSELRLLEPFYFDNPWSKTLEGKKVLVIHPFEDTIINQYKKRETLFTNPKVLPDFILKTIKSEQTNGGGLSDSKPFIESLKIMEDKIDNIDFDIALIGCGAYGLLLADYVKNLGKQAIHIGGGLQILFGIKGKRWDVHPEISGLYNNQWVRPMDNEKTMTYHTIEGGTYW